jgi:photosystem II stability/assembly factor-like uncharacterized protein
MPSRAIGLSFADPQHGWLIGTAGGGATGTTSITDTVYAMASTSDGGRCWHPVRLPAIDPHYDYQLPGGIYFVTAMDGWFYYRGLFSTHDGGDTWIDEHPEGVITWIQRAADGSLWALEDTGGEWTLHMVSVSPYRTWPKLGGHFPVTPDGASLTLADRGHAWLASWPQVQGGALGKLWVTADGARSWQELPMPCDQLNPNVGVVVAVDRSQLWLGCGQAAGAGSGTKFIYTSSDGGRSWLQRGKAYPLAEANLPIIGYFNGLSALSPYFAYMTWDRTTSVVLSRDGGASWEYSTLPCSLEFSRALFIDTLHGWAYDRPCVNRTVDGGKTWECIDLPGNKFCTH